MCIRDRFCEKQVCCRVLLWCQRLVLALDAPAVTPAVPVNEIRAAPRADTLVHQSGKRHITGFGFNAALELLIDRLTLFLGPPTPVGHIMLEAAGTPVNLGNK